MYITIITDDCNDTLSINNNCTNNDNNIGIKIPLFTIIPCGMSLICLISLIVYTLIKPLFNEKKIHFLYPRKIYSNKFCFINMYWLCGICDKIIYEELANNHLHSGYHKRLSDSIIKRYIVTNPKPNKINDTIRKYLRFHYKKYEIFLVILSVKLILPSNRIKRIGRQYPCHRNQGCIHKTFISKIKIFKVQLYSQILEMRITFVSRFDI